MSMIHVRNAAAAAALMELTPFEDDDDEDELGIDQVMDEDGIDDEDEDERKLNDLEKEESAFAGKSNTRYRLPLDYKTRVQLSCNSERESRHGWASTPIFKASYVLVTAILNILSSPGQQDSPD